MEFDGDGNVLYHDSSSGSIASYIQQSSSNWTFKIGEFKLFGMYYYILYIYIMSYLYIYLYILNYIVQCCI